MAISQDQAKVYGVIGDTIAKLLLVLIAGGVFIAFAVKIYHDPTPGWPIAVVESILAGTLYPVYGHYFPSRKK